MWWNHVNCYFYFVCNLVDNFQIVNYQVNQRVRITYNHSGVVIYGVVKGYSGPDLIVDRDIKGFGTVPTNHSNVKIEVL